MYLKIRADIFNAAIQAAARNDLTDLSLFTDLPAQKYRNRTFVQLCKDIPDLWQLLADYSSAEVGPINPAEDFFSYDPPGTWCKLRDLVGPGTWDLYGRYFSNSEEAVALAMQPFLQELEKKQDIWNARYSEFNTDRHARLMGRTE